MIPSQSFRQLHSSLIRRSFALNRPGLSSSNARFFANSHSQWEQQSAWRAGVASAAGVAAGATVFWLTCSDAFCEQPTTKAPAVDYDQVRKDIAAILDNDDHDDGSYGPIIVRLAWHASGSYDNTKGVKCPGGSNGATMRFNPECDFGANAGLGIARQVLESVKDKHPGISYADLWTLAGVVAIEHMGGPSINWRPGRTDAVDGSACPPDGRLPDAAHGADGIRKTFYRMGFNDKEIVALVGAHSLGRCHKNTSGYTGRWTNAPTTFSNEFFRLLLEEKWTEKKWSGPKQFEDKSGTLMMLPADLAFVEDPEFRKYVELFAKDEAAFFKEFSKAFSKLMELGVDFPQKGFFEWLQSYLCSWTKC